MGDYVEFTIFMTITGLSMAGLYLWMRDGNNADFMIEERPDREAFKAYLKRAPIKEKFRYALFGTRYVKNKPIIRV